MKECKECGEEIKTEIEKLNDVCVKCFDKPIIEDEFIEKFTKACEDLECGECSQNVSTITNYNCKLEFLDAKPNMYESVNKERLVGFLNDKELPQKKVTHDERKANPNDGGAVAIKIKEFKEPIAWGSSSKGDVLISENTAVDKFRKTTGGIKVENKEEGTKHDQGKIRWSLLPLSPLKKVIEVLEFGANKYSIDNWKQVSKERYKDALWRHWIAYCEDENSVDEESGESHLAHLLCCGIFLLWFKITGK